MGLRQYNPSPLLFLATTTTILLLLSTNVGVGNAVELCKHTDYPVLCRSYVKGRVGAAHATKSAIYATILKTMVAKSMAVKLIKNQDAMGKENLKACSEVYEDAISNLVTSMKNLKDKSKADLQINLSAAMADFGTCDDGFTENPGSVSPLAKVNGILRKLASNSLALASEVKY